MFRIAEFKKIRGQQIFKGFAFKGYKLDHDGNLSHYKKKISKNDKRRKYYVELNMGTGQTDIKGKPLYAEDLIFEHTNQVNGIIKYYPNMGGFLIRVDAGLIEIPYLHLNKDELKVEKYGTIYETKGRKNKWK